MLQGHIDSLLSSGFVEGWALDVDRPLSPLTLKLCVGDREVGRGIANLYREDLEAASIGCGWNAFRFRLTQPPEGLSASELTLVHPPTGSELHRRADAPIRDHVDPEIVSLAELLDHDPSLVDDLTKLNGCEPQMNKHLSAFGAGAFVRAAWIYLRGSLPPKNILDHHTEIVVGYENKLVDFLRLIQNSTTDGAARWTIVTPTDPGFPFGD